MAQAKGKASAAVAMVVVLLGVVLQCRISGAAAKPKTWIVGGAEGWTTVISMEGWAKGKLFHAGDTLVFKYDPDDVDVVMVSQKEHDSCTVNEGREIHDSGNDRFQLGYGPNYFICSDHDRCAAGTKLAIFAKSP